MKLSDNTFNYLFKIAIKRAGYHKAILTLFGNLSVTIMGEYTLVASVYKELMSIASKEDSDYETLFDVGEKADVYIEFDSMTMCTSLAGNPAYSDEFDDEEEEQYYDVLGDWDIDLKTREVEFNVRVDS